MLMTLLWLCLSQEVSSAVEIFSDPASLSEARRPLTVEEARNLRRHDAAELSFSEAMARFQENPRFFGSHIVEGLRKDPEAAKAFMLDQIKNPDIAGSIKQANAILSLCMIDPEAGFPHFKAYCEAHHPLHPPERLPEPNQAYEALFTEWIKSGSKRQAYLGFDLLPYVWPQPQCESYFWKFAGDPNYQFREFALEALTKPIYPDELDDLPSEKTSRFLSVISSMLQSPGQTTSAESLFRKLEYLSWISSTVKQRISDLLRHHLVQHPDQLELAVKSAPTPLETNAFQPILKPILPTLTAVGEVEALNLIKLRAIHLGQDAIPFLLNDLDHKSGWVVSLAIMTLGLVAEGSGNPQVISKLQKLFNEKKDPRNHVLPALARIGGKEAQSFVLAHIPTKANSYDRQNLTWCLAGMSYTRLLTPFAAAGLLPEMPSKYELWASHLEDQNVGAYGLMRALAGHQAALVFDTETSYTPVPHHELATRFAALTHGKLKISHAKQVLLKNEDGSLFYQVSFISRDRVYRFRAKDLNDWYDYKGVAAAMNGVLADQGFQERFIEPWDISQSAGFLFARPETIAEISKKIGLPLQDQIDAVETGKAFEAKVIAEIQKKLGR